jgi:hypothetical protein
MLLKSCMAFKYRGRVTNRYLQLHVYEDQLAYELQQYWAKMALFL